MSSRQCASSRPDMLGCSSDITSNTNSEDEISKTTRVQHDPRPPIPQLFFETERSSQEPQHTDRESPLIDPSPLHLDQSNHYHGPSQSSAREISEEQIPRVESNLQPQHAKVQDHHSPSSPNLDPLSEEEQWQRRLQKVMRILGEQVPPELISRGGPKPMTNASAFPEPPSLAQTDTLRRPECGEKQQNKSLRLARRNSLTLVSFPNLSSVAVALLPAGHRRDESRERTHLNGTITPKPNFPRGGGLEEGLDKGDDAPSRPEPMTLSSFIFAKDATSPRTRAFRRIVKNKSRPATAAGALESHSSQRRVDTNRAAKLPRRASLHAVTVILPSSPAQDHHNDRSGHMEPAPEVYIDSRLSQPESTLLSPIKFSKPPLPLTLCDQDHEDDFSSGSQTPSSRHRYHHISYAETLSERRRLGSSSSYSSSPDLLSLYSRPDTPFTDSAAPLEPEISAHQDSATRRDDTRDVVVRKERRQGWSGEWNREDMQVVIKQLRSLK
jgi:hypothetical protein